MSALLPLFQAPDEQLHYATIQYRNEPEEKTWSTTNLKKRQNIGSDISTYGFSEETIRSAQATQFDEVKFQNENTQAFAQSDTGLNEIEITKNQWKRYIDIYPTNTSGTKSIYYYLASKIEQLLSNETILMRFFTTRFLAVLFGAIVVLFVYLISKKLSFSERNSLILATLVAFQPMFSASAAQVNIDIALILSFSLYIYAAIAALKDGINWKNFSLIIFSLILAVYSKGPGIVLVTITPFLLGYLIFKKYSFPIKKFLIGALFSFFILISIVFLLVPKNYLVSITNLSASSEFSSPIESLSRYFDKTITFDAWLRTEASYWGHFGWLDTRISDAALNVIVILEIAALIGVILYLVSGTKFFASFKMAAKRVFGMTGEKNYLPEKKFVLFSIGIIVALQLAIRFYDWRIFDTTGKILIGTPGRYFLPNIIPHIILMVTGLGYFTRNKRQFAILLKTLLILMILLSLYSMINVIIPRYYL